MVRLPAAISANLQIRVCTVSRAIITTSEWRISIVPDTARTLLHFLRLRKLIAQGWNKDAGDFL